MRIHVCMCMCVCVYLCEMQKSTNNFYLFQFITEWICDLFDSKDARMRDDAMSVLHVFVYVCMFTHS